MPDVVAMADETFNPRAPVVGFVLFARVLRVECVDHAFRRRTFFQNL